MGNSNRIAQLKMRSVSLNSASITAGDCSPADWLPDKIRRAGSEEGLAFCQPEPGTYTRREKMQRRFIFGSFSDTVLPTSVLVYNFNAVVAVTMWTNFAAFALLTQHVASQNINVGRLLRFSCSQLVIERTDPLVNPGMNPSTHVHQIVGGNSFNVTVSPPASALVLYRH